MNICDEINKLHNFYNNAPAITSPGRKAITYNDLWVNVNQLSNLLKNIGIRNGDIVAMAMPDGAESIITMMAIMRTAVCAPLNFCWCETEFKDVLQKMHACALIVLNN
jgi:acyl-coenzyme A synthetase/AMP-(fatty) acid ligase